MTDRYDCIVVGVGGMGSAAVYRLADRGLDVLGLERFDVPHARGSSHGSTRIVRLTQPEDPSYVPLARAAFEKWRGLEATTGRDLLSITGSIHAGEPDADLVDDARASLDAHDVEYEDLDAAEVNERFPGYDLPEDYRAVYQPDGGFVDCERAVSAHVEAGHAAGATIRARERVTEWRETGAGVRVETTKGSYDADHLVFAAGAWSEDLLPSLTPHLTPVRRVMAWFQPERPASYRPESFPVFSLAGREGYGYGFPVHDVPGFKVGVEPDADDPFGDADPVDPDDWNREPTPTDEERHRAFAASYFPDAAGPTLRLRTCLLTNSPDDHFVLGPHPGYNAVHVAAGFTGHGFKFAALAGELLADFVIDGETDHDLSLHRPARLFDASV